MIKIRLCFVVFFIFNLIDYWANPKIRYQWIISKKALFKFSSFFSTKSFSSISNRNSDRKWNLLKKTSFSFSISFYIKWLNCSNRWESRQLSINWITIVFNYSSFSSVKIDIWLCHYSIDQTWINLKIMLFKCFSLIKNDPKRYL